MLKRVFLAAFFLLLPAIVWAGDFSDGIYTSNLGYSVQPPQKWARLDASNAAAMKGHVPENIAIKSTERFDVIFFPNFMKADTSLTAENDRLAKNKEILDADKNAAPDELLQPISDKIEPPEFSPMISILVLNIVPSKITPEMVKVYEEQLISMNEQEGDYSGFKVLGSTMSTSLDGGDAFIYNIEFRRNRMAYKVEQTIIFHTNETLIVTCMEDANDFNDDKMWCKNVVGTIKFR